MKSDEIFFGKEGYTSTSANHIADMAKEYCANTLNELKSIGFLDTSISLLSGGEERKISAGVSESYLASLSDKLRTIATAKGLSAWLREAVKARERMLKEVNKIKSEDIASIIGVAMPIEPAIPAEMTEDDYMSSLSIKERNLMYTLQAKCAAFGEFIHPSGAFSTARKEFYTRTNTPYKTTGTGHDMVIHSFVPSVSADAVDKAFFDMQEEYREYQKRYNEMKYKMDSTIRMANESASSKYASDMELYNTEMKSVSAKILEWRRKRSAEISAYKIVIPDSLKPTLSLIESLGK